VRSPKRLVPLVTILALVAWNVRAADPKDAAAPSGEAALQALDMEARRQALEMLERDLEAKVQALQQLREETEASLREQQKQQTEDLQTLVKLYEAMKPKSAARLLEELPVDLAAEVLSAMKSRGAGKILNAVAPARAVQISRRLAGKQK
jgi:flagellar motility protein MotE (MotC chaperone)